MSYRKMFLNLKCEIVGNYNMPKKLWAAGRTDPNYRKAQLQINLIESGKLEAIAFVILMNKDNNVFIRYRTSF